jgi:methyl coenzyme M reductase alpha subunit
VLRRAAAAAAAAACACCVIFTGELQVGDRFGKFYLSQIVFRDLYA